MISEMSVEVHQTGVNGSTVGNVGFHVRIDPVEAIDYDAILYQDGLLLDSVSKNQFAVDDRSHIASDMNP
jgi:hypothetical protein